MPIRRSPNGARHVRPQPGRNRPERVVAVNRNAWSQSVGIGGRNHPVRARSARSGRKPASRDAGSTRLQTCWPSCRRASNRKPSVRCRTSGWLKPKSTPRPHSTPSSKATRSSTTRPPNACARIAGRCWHSMTSLPSSGNTFERQTRSRVRSRPSATEPSDPKVVSRTGRRSPWCSSWSMALRKIGVALMATHSCQNLSWG